jgi:hypothetical protein
MTFENFARCLQAFVRVRPFRPYLLQLIAGEMIRVGHPEAVRLHGGIAFVIEPDNHRHFFDASSVCQFVELPLLNCHRHSPITQQRSEPSMTAGEFQNRLLSLLRREPFEPFEVELLDGQRFLVARAETVATNGVIATFWGEDSPAFLSFDWRTTRRLGSDVATASA